MLEGHTETISLIAFSPNGKQIVSCSVDYIVQLWDINTRIILQTFKGHTDLIKSVAFSLDSKQIMSCSYDTTVWLWDVNTGAVL